jgi:hypothetical protein
MKKSNCEKINQSSLHTCFSQMESCKSFMNVLFRAFVFFYIFIWWIVLLNDFSNQVSLRIHQEIIFFNLMLTIVFLLTPTKVFLTIFLILFLFTSRFGIPFLLTNTYGCPEGMIAPKPFLDYITSKKECQCVNSLDMNGKFRDCISNKDRMTYLKCLTEWKWSERECEERIMWYSDKRK